MNKEDFLKSLSLPVDDYGALRKIEQKQEPRHEAYSFEELGEEGQLAVDVFETNDHIVIMSTVAGAKPEELDVSVNGDMVTIRGKRHDETEEKDRTYYYRECYFGRFSRSVILPVHVLGDRAEASLKNGLLTIRIPKASPETRVPVIERD